MDWILKPILQNTFSNIGFINNDGLYTIFSESCSPALETILLKILREDNCLRTCRRIMNSEQHLTKDIIPLLIHTKDNKSIELLIMILAHLTIPLECLFSVNDISRTDLGKHTIFDIKNLLLSAKVAFTDRRVTKVVTQFLKNNMSAKLSPEQSKNINYCLILLQNILKVPEQTGVAISNHRRPGHSLQNKIIRNIFSQGIHQKLNSLLNIPEAANWIDIVVELIGVLYEDKLAGQLSELMIQENQQGSPADSLETIGSKTSYLVRDSTSDSSEKDAAGSSNGCDGASTSTAPSAPLRLPTGEPTAAGPSSAYCAPPARLCARKGPRSRLSCCQPYYQPPREI